MRHDQSLTSHRQDEQSNPSEGFQYGHLQAPHQTASESKTRVELPVPPHQ